MGKRFQKCKIVGSRNLTFFSFQRKRQTTPFFSADAQNKRFKSVQIGQPSNVKFSRVSLFTQICGLSSFRLHSFDSAHGAGVAQACVFIFPFFQSFTCVLPTSHCQLSNHFLSSKTVKNVQSGSNPPNYTHTHASKFSAHFFQNNFC